MDNIPQFLTWAVIFLAVPLNWYVVFRLWQLAVLSPLNRVLRDRLLVATFLAGVVTAFGLVFLNNDQDVPLLVPSQTMFVTRTAIILLIVPAVYWLALYSGSRVDKEAETDQDIADEAREVKRDDADAAREVKRDEADAAREESRENV